MRRESRLVFVIGAPRSGTTFLAGALGAQPGLLDLGEVKPLKGARAFSKRASGLSDSERRDIRE